MSKPDISVVVCTFERPDNLRRVLASIAGQRGVDGKFEVVVADDGSRDETLDVLAEARRTASFSLRFVTHPHAGFCPGRCRNEGVANSRADYVLLLDGDCLIPPDHLRIHLERRLPGVVRLGDHIRMSEAASRQISEQMAFRGAYLRFIPAWQRLGMMRKALKTSLYNLWRHPSKPRLVSNNVGIWRKDYLAVNGFDENYVGWGCEDDDFGVRLRRRGLRLLSSLWWTCSYHLWHPPVATMPTRWSDGPNVAYFSRGFRLVNCGNGLVKRQADDVAIRITGCVPTAPVLRTIVPLETHLRPHGERQAEIELLFAPSEVGFSGQADCNVLVVLDSRATWTRHYRDAHVVMADESWPYTAKHRFALHEFHAMLDFLLYNKRPPGEAGHSKTIAA